MIGLHQIQCFACDPKTNGTNYNLLGVKDISSIEKNSADEENLVELYNADNHQKNNDCDDNSNENFNEESNEDHVNNDDYDEENNLDDDDEENNEDTGELPSTLGMLKCSSQKCLQKNNMSPTALVSCSNPKYSEKNHAECFKDFMNRSKSLKFEVKVGLHVVPPCGVAVSSSQQVQSVSDGSAMAKWAQDITYNSQ
jgi:hypothetical protein